MNNIVQEIFEFFGNGKGKVELNKYEKQYVFETVIRKMSQQKNETQIYIEICNDIIDQRTNEGR